MWLLFGWTGLSLSLFRPFGTLHNALENTTYNLLENNEEDKQLLEQAVASPDIKGIVGSGERLAKLENILHNWTVQIQLVLNEAEQIRREADDVGPAAELAYWRMRMAKFNRLLEQLVSPEVRTVTVALSFAKSRGMKLWSELNNKITDAANEAKTNVRFLTNLDKFLGPLAKNGPIQLTEQIPGLLNAIRMIYEISHYYNTPERMTSLMVKVTNQMITSCRKYIYQGVSRIWDLPR
ncbi:unnamed protein product [Dibothriocephalus latus]|uniref:Dynein heavy chain tail domain-containing protein n=1 Tax=Dibothriocephalus latus TaxID=60516 RepID=A0A3P7ND44_DIBLA|nr:unnamed protein product [Dibothriocephalus latus]